MRFGSISLLIVVGILGVSCGSGGSGSAGGPALNDDTAYQTPPSNYEPPPALNPKTYEPPPGSYDTPPGQTNAGGIGTGPSIGDVWDRVCNEVLALNCDFSKLGSGNDTNSGNNGNTPRNGNDTTTMMPASSMTSAQACAQAGEQLAQSIPCPDEFAAALSCILDNITLTCDLFTSTADNQKIDQSIAVTCQAPLLAFAQCDASTQPVAQPQGPCMPDSCLNCAGACDRCLCQNSGDAAPCNSICINQ